MTIYAVLFVVFKILQETGSLKVRLGPRSDSDSEFDPEFQRIEMRDGKNRSRSTNSLAEKVWDSGSGDSESHLSSSAAPIEDEGQ
jgi:hypothetical protein